MPFRLFSLDFDGKQSMPVSYTADGEGISPHLEWEDPPAETETLALIVGDPDAPGGSFVHWVLYNLSPDLYALSPGVPRVEVLRDLDNARQGKNGVSRIGYLGPAPPDQKTHHYHFQLTALDRAAEPRGLITADELEQAMRGHVLARTELIGTYRRAQRVRRAA